MVSESTEDVHEVEIERFDNGQFKGWGEPLTFTSVAVGGAIGNVMFVFCFIFS